MNSDERDWIIMDSDEELEMSDLSINEKVTLSRGSHDNDYYSILCIDIGVINLGMSVIICDRNTYAFRDVVGVDLLDITTFPHPPGGSCECCLNHTKTFTDWMEHIFQYYRIVFDSVDKILIERQPPMGFVAVEQLIFTKYRHKCELISPNSVHKFFGIGKYDYNTRKQRVEEIALKYIKNPAILEEFMGFERRHDMADSVCIGIFWLDKNNKEYTQRKHILDANKRYAYALGMTSEEFFRQFRFSG